MAAGAALRHPVPAAGRAMGKLDGKAALATGAGRGTGAAAAQALAAEGAAVTLCARDAAACASRAREIEAAGGPAAAVACDVTDLAAVQAAVAETLRRFGRLDVLMNNAGIIEPIAPLAAVLRGFIALPLGLMLGAFLWQMPPTDFALRYDGVPKFVLMGVAITLTDYFGHVLGSTFEDLLFAGDFKAWTAGTHGTGTPFMFMLLWPLSYVIFADDFRRTVGRWWRESYGRNWVMGSEKAAYRGGCRSLPDPPEGAMRL
jgi:hypothetical protein